MNNLEKKQQLKKPKKTKQTQKQTYTYYSKDMRTHIHTC